MVRVVSTWLALGALGVTLLAAFPTPHGPVNDFAGVLDAAAKAELTTLVQTARAPRIASPLRSVSYALRRSAPGEVIALEASAAADVRTLFWFDGSALIGARPVAEGPLAWRPAAAGAHLIRIVDDHGRSAERDVQVQITR